MRRRHLAIAMLLLAACLLAGCGQKGELFRPDAPSASAPASAASSAAPATHPR